MGSRNINENKLLSLDTPESCYLLGFLWADGYLLTTEKPRYKISLEIVTKDFIEIIPVLNFFGKWQISHRKRKNRQHQSCGSLFSKIVYEKLTDFNYKNRSLGTNIVNYISKDLKHYWYLGFHDGDGCFYYNKKLYNKKVSMSSCYNQNWSFITNQLDILNIKYNIYKKTKNIKSRSSTVEFGSIDSVIKWGEYIYKNKIKNIGLSRKYQKYLDIKNSFNHN